MKLIGLTGGIGSGKSTVAKVFESIGVPVFYADEVGKELLDQSPEVIKAVKRLFGDDLYSAKGMVDRSRLAGLVFSDKEKLAALNEIIHPAVRNATEQWLNRLDGLPYAIKEAAILFESGSNKQCHGVICVYADEELRVQRVIDRDGTSADDVRKRMANQWPAEKVRQLSDFVIENSGNTSVIQQVLAIDRQLRS